MLVIPMLVMASVIMVCLGAIAPNAAMEGAVRQEPPIATISVSTSPEPTATLLQPSDSPDVTASTTPVPEESMPVDVSMTASPSADVGVPTTSPADSMNPTGSTSPTGAMTPDDVSTTEQTPSENSSGPPATPSPTTGVVGDEDDAEASESDEPICIDANALTHLSSDELVYKEHRRGAVLCDKNGSCATPGHMVAYNGKFMMMSSYCTHSGGCAKRVMNVNSPRHRRALKIPSRTDGLHYTSLAARYATVAEEHVLKTLLRVGV